MLLAPEHPLVDAYLGGPDAAAKREAVSRFRGRAHCNDFSIGVELELNVKVSNILETMKEGGFDAAFLAVGAHIAKRAYIPAGAASHIVDAVSLLRSMEGEEKPMLRHPASR